MSIATFPIDFPVVLVRPDDDRSLGDTGSLIRAGVLEAISGPDDDRGEEVYARVLRALNKARDEDGTLVNAGTFGRTLELLNLLPRWIPLPEVVVENEREIGLDWDEGVRRTLTLTVRDTPLVGFSTLIGIEPMYGRVVVAGEIPEILSILLARIYPRTRYLAAGRA